MNYLSCKAIQREKTVDEHGEQRANIHHDKPDQWWQKQQ
jgi:hypothetical protein